MDQLNIGVRFALYATLLPLFGLALFALYAPAAGKLNHDDQRWWLAAGATAALVFSASSIAVMTAAMMGVGVGEIGIADIWAILTGMSAGTAWIVRFVALAVVIAAIVVGRWSAMPAAAAAGSGVALASLAWTGHGGMDEGARGIVHASSDIVHLLAAGAWLGGLLALAALLSHSAKHADYDRAYLSLARFASVGTIAVALLVFTGLVNSWLLIGVDRLPALWTSLYGQLLLVKLALFVVMLGLAASNRFRLTPALRRGVDGGRTAPAISDLRRSLAIETAAAMGILGLVAWLGTLAPPISA